MSTVKSLSFYHDLKGIADYVSLTHSGDNDWSLVSDFAGKDASEEYGCAFIHARHGEIIQIWGCTTYVPYNGSHCELIYSNSKTWAVKRQRELKALEAEKTHYIAMAGIHGCLPAYCASHETYDSAVESLAEIHELSGNKTRILRRDGYIELSMAKHGNEYAEITECTCDDPESHND